MRKRVKWLTTLSLANAIVVLSFSLASARAAQAQLTQSSDSQPQTEEPAQLKPLEVKDVPYAETRSSLATKIDAPLLETPVSVQVVPREVMEDQQATRLEKALNNVSGVFSAPQTSGGGTSDNTLIRGFATPNTYYDGVRTVGGASATGPEETADVAKIEVLKGPAAILYGRVEPGGIVNLVKKEPLVTPGFSVQQLFGSYGYKRTVADATGPVFNRNFLFYRAIIAHEDADSFQDYRSSRHDFFSGALRWEISPRTKVNASLEYKNAKDPIDYGIPVTDGNKPIDVPRHFSANEPNNHNNSNNTIARFDWEHALKPDWSIKQSLGWRYTSASNQTTAPDVWQINYSLGAPVQNGPRVLDRYTADGSLRSHTFLTSLDVNGKFETGTLKHNVLLGADYNKFKQAPGPAKAWVATFLDVDTGLRTDLGEGLTGTLIQDAVYWLQEEWFGVYAQDQIKLPFNVDMLIGLRRDHARERNVSIDPLYGDTDSRADDYGTTPRFGLLWRATPWLSLYGNYVENFGAANTTNAKASLGLVPPPLKPQTAQQKEIGLKAELLGGKLISTFALFDIAKQNITAPDPVNIGRSILVGEVTNRGWELDMSGEVNPHWHIVVAASGINSKVTRDAMDAAGAPIGNQGKRLFNVPRLSGSLWTTYDIANWRFGGGVVVRGRREGDLANTYYLPGYTVMNLMAAYRWKAQSYSLTAQLNLDNVFDRYYFSAATGSRNLGAYVGEPRTLSASLKAEF